MMQIDEKELYAKILITYPDITELNIDVNLHYDREYNVWIVRLEQEGQRIYTHLKPEEAKALYPYLETGDLQRGHRRVACQACQSVAPEGPAAGA